MDSFTQIVLGASVGEAVMGRKVGNKAMLWGALAGTIPDLDVLVSHFTDTVTALEMHRGFTHSFVFAALAGPLFGGIVNNFARYKDFKGWSWLFFWGFLTHALLDAFTTWGTQLFWPFDIRLAFKSVFVIDPLYTLPFVIFVVLAAFQRKGTVRRSLFNRLGLIVSSCYLLLGLILKGIAHKTFERALDNQGIPYLQLDTRPAPLTTLLWTANVETDEAYYIGYYSFFDQYPIQYSRYPKNHHRIADLLKEDKMQRMIHVSRGWYTISEKEGRLFFNDLRFGLMGINPKEQNFVFSYQINKDDKGQLYFIEAPKTRNNAQVLLGELWNRIKGN